MAITITERIDADAASTDWRVLLDGKLVGFLSDLAIDDDKTPGTKGFQGFDRGGTYVGEADTAFDTAELIAAREREWRLREADQ